MQFVIIADHSPESCPTSSSKIRELLAQSAKEMPGLAARLELKVVTINVLGPDHRIVAVVEAEQIERVQNFVLESRLVQWNTVHVHASWTIEEALANASKLPALF